MAAKKVARLADRPEDFARLGIHPTEIAQKEDALHTTGKFGEYEWWYSDFKLEDGWNLVIVFYSQPVTAACVDFKPSVTLSLTRDGEEYFESFTADVKDCVYDRERCCVKLADKCWIEGDLKEYKLHFDNGKVTADVTLHANAASWRPQSGHFLFDEKKYFAWLPSVPEGTAHAGITIGERKLELSGSGYHDHNWGNIGMFWVMHHWYWGRAKIGDYQAITSYITARKQYGYEHFPIFLLLKNGEKLGDAPQYLTYTQSEPEYDSATKKHYHKKLVYDYNDGTQHYRVTYAAENIIETFYYTQATKDSANASAGPLLIWLVKQARLDPSYIRMTGTVTLERFEGDAVAETVQSHGIWEQMYFGLDEDV